jgi:hypothetical protein
MAMPDTSHVAYLVYCPECGDIVAEFATIDDAQRYAVLIGRSRYHRDRPHMSAFTSDSPTEYTYTTRRDDGS